MINLIKELKVLLELLRESLTNLTTKPHAKPKEKKTNKVEDLQNKQTKQKVNPNNNKLQTSLLSLPNPTIPYPKNWITMKAHH